METASILSPGSSHKPTPARKVGGGIGNDLWAAARNGSIQDVDLVLTKLKRNNGNVDARSALGSTALHIAVWRNHIPTVRRLLAAGANPDARVSCRILKIAYDISILFHHKRNNACRIPELR